MFESTQELKSGVKVITTDELTGELTGKIRFSREGETEGLQVEVKWSDGEAPSFYPLHWIEEVGEG